MPNIIPIKDEAHWRQVRMQHVGGSDIAALFNESAYLTRFMLWHFKKGSIEDAMEDNERTFWGKKLEAGIAQGIAEQMGWKIMPPEGYYVHPKIKGMGCTPDFFIMPPVPGYKGMGVLQIKNVSYLEYRDNWADGEPPLSYLLQLQHEIACTGYSWGAIGALIGGNEGVAFPYQKHTPSILRIESAVKKFWQTIINNEEPSAVAQDYSILKRLYRSSDNQFIDLIHDNEMPELCAAAVNARLARLEAEKIEEGAKAEILRKTKGATTARCTGFDIEYPLHTMNMQEIPAHIRTYRKLNIKENMQ